MILRALWCLQAWHHIYASLIKSSGWVSRCLCTLSAHVIEVSNLYSSRKDLRPSFLPDVSVISWSRWKTKCKPLTISTTPTAFHFFPTWIYYCLALDQLQRLSSRQATKMASVVVVPIHQIRRHWDKFLLRRGWWIIISSGNHTMHFTLPPTYSSNKHWPVEWIP